MNYKSGLDYQIPGVFVGAPQTAGGPTEQPAGGIPETPGAPKDYLATVEGYTNKYFDTYGKLQAFAKGMADQGVDVFQPDFSQPGGGLAFQTANKLQAELKYAANDLAETRDVKKFLREQQAAGNILPQAGFDPTQGSLSQQNPSDMFYSTDLDKQVVEANNFLNKEFYTDADAQRANAAAEPLRNYYRNQIAKDPQNASYYQRQLAAIGTASKKTPYSAFMQSGKGDGNKNDPKLAILKRVTNIKSGAWEDGSYKPVTKDGKVYLENMEFSGDSMGEHVIKDKNGTPTTRPKTLKRWLKDPNTGRVFAEFDDPDMPLEEVSNKPGSAVFSSIGSNNPKYGDVSRTLDAAIEKGILTAGGASNDEMLLADNYQDLQKRVRDSGVGYSKTIDKVKDGVKSQLKKLSDPAWWGSNATEKFPTEKGDLIVGKHRGKDLYFIENYEDFGFDKEPKNLSLDDIIKYLDDPTIRYKGFHLSQPTVVETAPKPTTPTPAPKNTSANTLTPDPDF